MADLITTDVISGGKVYGIDQVSYTVDGESGQDYSTALAIAAFRQSVAIEDATSAYSAVVREREKKMEDVGELLAVLSKAMANKDPKSNDKNKVCYSGSDLYEAVNNCKKYGISVSVTVDGGSASITFGEAYKAQANIKFELDKEDNDLQQDVVTLQSYLSKRDNAYSTAARIVKKANDTASGTIANIGK